MQITVTKPIEEFITRQVEKGYAMRAKWLDRLFYAGWRKKISMLILQACAKSWMKREPASFGRLIHSRTIR